MATAYRMRIKTLLIQFGNEISSRELPLLRGAIIDLVSQDDLFHNHAGDGFIYRYPLIQYKRIHRQAAIMSVGQGTEQIGKILEAGSPVLRIGDNEEKFTITKITPGNFLVQAWDSHFEYHLRNWLALNQENHSAYMDLTSVVERASFLQEILTGNILSMCKGLGVTIEKEITCELTRLDEPKLTKYKGNKMMSFDVDFRSNISIPDYIGLGKGVSLGHGTVVRKYSNQR